MNRIEQAFKNIQDIPKIKSLDPNFIVPLYADKDGMWYLYTIWHIEQAIKIMGV